MRDLFISKSTKDDQIAMSLFRRLEKLGINCWIANESLPTKAGEEYATDIVEAISDSTAFLFIMSKNSNASAHCKNEVSTACSKKKRIFVLQIEDFEFDKFFTYYFSHIQMIKDFEVKKTGNFEKIIREISDFLNVTLENNNNLFVDKEVQKKFNFEKLRDEKYEIRHALITSIEDCDRENDNDHIYEEIIRLDVVDTEKNDWKSYRFLTIKNDSTEPTRFIIHKETGECKTSFDAMRIRARLEDYSGKKMQIESLTKIQPNDVQVFKILFPAPLNPNEKMTIFYRLDWPNEPCSYYMEELSQSISLLRYTKGVKKLTFAVFEPYKITSSSLSEIDHMNVNKISEIKPVILDIKDEELLEPLHNENYCGVKYTIDLPCSKLYQINYTKECDKDEDNEEDFF